MECFTRVTATCVLLMPSLLTAETFNPFGNETVIRSGSGGSGDVGSALADPSLIQDNSALNETRGRRRKTEDAIDKGKQGVGAAIAAGTALTAMGVSLLPPPTTPQGVALITKGALEFAQAAATGAATRQNTQGRDTLKEGTPEGNQLDPGKIAQQVRARIDTPQLRQALGERGVNSDAFIEQVASGNLRSFDEVKAALGVTDEFTPDQVARAELDAQGFFAGATHHDDNGREDSARVAMDDERGSPGPVMPDAEGAAFRGLTSAGEGEGSGLADARGELPAAENGATEAGLKAMAEALADRELAEARRQGFALDRDRLVAKYLAELDDGPSRKRRLALGRELALEKKGIKKLRRGQNIFRVAQITYRGYGRWRGKSRREAARGAPAPRPTVTDPAPRSLVATWPSDRPWEMGRTLPSSGR